MGREAPDLIESQKYLTSPHFLGMNYHQTHSGRDLFSLTRPNAEQPFLQDMTSRSITSLFIPEIQKYTLESNFISCEILCLTLQC